MPRTPPQKALAAAVGLATAAQPASAAGPAGEAGGAKVEAPADNPTGDAARLLFSRAAAQRLLARQLAKTPPARKAKGRSYAALAQYFKELADRYEKRAREAEQPEAPTHRPPQAPRAQ